MSGEQSVSLGERPFCVFAVAFAGYRTEPDGGYFDYRMKRGEGFLDYTVQRVEAGTVPAELRFGIAAIYRSEAEARAVAAILASLGHEDVLPRVRGIYDMPIAWLVRYVTFIQETGEGRYLIEPCLGGETLRTDDRDICAIFEHQAEADSYALEHNVQYEFATGDTAPSVCSLATLIENWQHTAPEAVDTARGLNVGERATLATTPRFTIRRVQ